MKYSYNDRKFVLNDSSKSTEWDKIGPLYFVFFVGMLLSGVLRPHLGYAADLGYIVAASLLAFGSILKARHMAKKQQERPDVPTSLEISDHATFGLFHGDTKYAEIPVEQIDFITESKILLLPWGSVLATELSIRPAYQGIDRVYIFPYLNGYTEFVEKIRGLSPKFLPFSDQTEWGGTSRKEETGYLLPVLSLILGMVFVRDLPIFKHYETHSWLQLMEVAGEIAILAGILALIVYKVEKPVSLITFSPGKLVVRKGLRGTLELRPTDIISIDIMPPDKEAEHCVVRLRDGSFSISPEYHRDYEGVIQRLKAFAEQAV